MGGAVCELRLLPADRPGGGVGFAVTRRRGAAVAEGALEAACSARGGPDDGLVDRLGRTGGGIGREPDPLRPRFARRAADMPAATATPATGVPTDPAAPAAVDLRPAAAPAFTPVLAAVAPAAFADAARVPLPVALAVRVTGLPRPGNPQRPPCRLASESVTLRQTPFWLILPRTGLPVSEPAPEFLGPVLRGRGPPPPGPFGPLLGPRDERPRLSDPESSPPPLPKTLRHR